MTVSNYFRSNYSLAGDQALLQSLTIETIQLKGRDILYIPREFVAFDDLYGEDKLSAFTKTYTIEMYIENAMGFGGQQEFIGKYGFEIRDEIVMCVSKERFQSVVTRYEDKIQRPREGDLLFFPLDQSLFEITFAQNEAVYYELGRIFTYQLSCKRFELAAETFDTGVPIIDELQTLHGNTTEILLDVGTGTFEQGEIVYQGTNVASASMMGQVVLHDISDVARPRLVLTAVKGSVDPTLPIVGATTGVSYTIKTELNGQVSQTNNVTDAAAANLTFIDNDNSEQVIDRTVANPYDYGY